MLRGNMKTYHTFLFDLDDTLLNFSESEVLSFKHTVELLKIETPFESLYSFYKIENSKLWDAFDKGLISKETLKIQRFKALIDKFHLPHSPEKMSQVYLETLPETVVLLDGAIELLQALTGKAQVGLITKIRYQKALSILLKSNP